MTETTQFARRLREEGWSRAGAIIACSKQAFVNGRCVRITRSPDVEALVAEVWAEPMRCPDCGERWPGADHDCALLEVAAVRESVTEGKRT